MLPTELYAQVLSRKCAGEQSCHWCGGPCDRTLLHNDPPRIPFQKTPNTAKNYSSIFCCVGCWLWLRGSISVAFLTDERLRDKQKACNHSWWITGRGAWGLEPSDYSTLYEQLLKPPLRFCLMLNTDKNTPNHLHMAVLNEMEVIDAATPLRFTLNNVIFQYSVYELEQALKSGTIGKEPGVRELMTVMGQYDFSKPPVPEVIPPEPKGHGRPPAPDSPKKRIR